LAGGRGIELLTHAKNVMYPGKDSVIKNREIYRAAVFMVQLAIMKPTMLKARGMVICQNRSPVLSECLVKGNATKVANIHGGAHRSSVTVGLYPIVAQSVGKNTLKLIETTMPVSASASHQTFQSVIALIKPAILPRSASP